MTILNQFLRVLELLEASQDLFEFLTDPMGLSGVTAVCLYFPMMSLGCDGPSAMTLSSTAALTMYCLLKRPEF